MYLGLELLESVLGSLELHTNWMLIANEIMLFLELPVHERVSRSDSLKIIRFNRVYDRWIEKRRKQTYWWDNKKMLECRCIFFKKSFDCDYIG